MSFSHKLITQFNLRNFPKSSNSAHEQWLTWTRNRIELFKAYCLPSVLNQSNKDFQWLIFFDAGTPDEFSFFIDELKTHSLIQICYCDGSEDFFQNYFKEITNRITNEKWTITTRLDNDDTLHRDAIATIQMNFVEKDKFLISLASGYVFDVERKVLAHYFYPMSPFISLIEKVSTNAVGVFAKIHTQWPALRLFIFKEVYLEFFKPSKRMSRFILKSPMWVQIFHGRNVSNSFYRGFPVTRSMNLSTFGINITSNPMSLGELPKFRSYVTWKRYFKCWAIKNILRK